MGIMAAGTVTLKLSMMQTDGSVAASKELTVRIDTAGGCPARRTRVSGADARTVHWMPLGFDEGDDETQAGLDSIHEWLADLLAHRGRCGAQPRQQRHPGAGC